MRLSGNSVLITGGATGIGYAMAKAFLDAGSVVIVCGRRVDRLEEVRRRHPAIHVHACDVAKPADRLALVEWTSSSFGGFNVLVNNAGIQRDIDFSTGIAEFEAGENEIAINLEAPIVLSGLAVPYLTGRENGAIINVSSGLGFVPAAKMPVYSATKAGMHAFSMALRHQLSRVGIKVFEVVPPMVDTELNPEGRAKRGGFRADLTAETFVLAVMKAIEEDTFEIGYGMTQGMLKASRAELESAFIQMNRRL
ncbi:MAG TPA: SDR family NAD(P)-dependent oxidoreductase [Polyangiaceae bacterium]